MFEDKKLAVVVPAYNEEALIGNVISTMPGYVDKIYIVDDCSTDDTSKVVQGFNDQRVVLTRHEKNKGVGAAIVTGYKLALKEDMDLIAVMAGDNQMDPEQLPGLLDPVVKNIADYSKGNRLSSNDHKKGMSRWRRFGNFLLGLLTKISTGYWNIQDPQNGYTVISKNALSQLNLDKVYPLYGYCNDLLAKMKVLGLRVWEVQMPSRYGSEKSKIKYGTYIRKVSMLLLRNFLWRLGQGIIISISKYGRYLKDKFTSNKITPTYRINEEGRVNGKSSS